MSKNFSADPALYEYAHSVFRPEDPVLAEIRERAEKAGLPAIHVGSFDGLHLEVLARMSGARKIVEIGTLAGYSGVCLARALPADGRLYTFEYEPAHAKVAEESFRRAGVAERTKVFVGPALANLAKIEGEGPFDLVFIDADKENYPHYLDWAAKHLRKGGAVIGDNTFAWGLVLEKSVSDLEDRAALEGITRFNRGAAEKFRATILPTGEGLTVAVKT